MKMPTPRVEPIGRIRFGLFEVDLESGLLTRHGVRLKLQEQPFRILIMLLQRHGEIVTREQFRAALWPEGTHVNFDGSLNAALKKLRSTLQDDADNPLFIETIPKQGYRFLAPIRAVSDATASFTGDQVTGIATSDQSIELRLHLHPNIAQGLTGSAPDWNRERVERTQRWFDMFLLFAGILFGSWLLFFLVYPVPHPSVQRMTRIADAARIDEWGGIVSDGTRIFFLERNEGRWNLMQTSVEGGNAEKMPAPFENTRLFAISPDHSQFLIGQFNRHEDEMPLWLWPVQGGEPRRLGMITGADPSFSSDGNDIAFVRDQSVYSVHRDGTQVRQLATVQGHPHTPTWTPDGSAIRFTITGDLGAKSIWEMTADGYGLHEILNRAVPPPSRSGGNWTADGKYFLFSGCEEDNCNLWGIRNAWSWFRRSHHDPFPLTSGPDSLHVAIPAQIGSRIFAFSSRSHRELQSFATSEGTLHASTVPLDTYAVEAAISPDDQMVVYSHAPDGSLWCSRIDGQGRLPLTIAPLRGETPRWSPDGKRILFTGFRPGQTRSIYFISPDGGSLRAILPSGWEGSEADWSPDGYRVVVAMSNHKAQREQSLYTLEPTTGTVKELASSKGFREPRWSPDGRRIAALDSLRNRVLVYDLQSGEWSEIASGSLLATVHWARDGSAVMFQDQLDGQQSIYRADLASHRVTQALGFAEILRGSATHCLFAGTARDGSFYAMVERGVTDIYTLDLDLP
jgi:Tol biopolymer transport system component/DNA-binding winged helix-turn-helix (wHTH) protein